MIYIQYSLLPLPHPCISGSAALPRWADAPFAGHLICSCMLTCMRHTKGKFCCCLQRPITAFKNWCSRCELSSCFRGHKIWAVDAVWNWVGSLVLSQQWRKLSFDYHDTSWKHYYVKVFFHISRAIDWSKHGDAFYCWHERQSSSISRKLSFPSDENFPSWFEFKIHSKSAPQTAYMLLICSYYPSWIPQEATQIIHAPFCSR